MKQKFIIADFDFEGNKRINAYLDDGWRIVNMVAQHVSTSVTGESYASKDQNGKLAIVLQKD